MKKKVLIAALLMSLAITACGGKATEESQAQETPAAEESVQEEESEEELPETEPQNPLDGVNDDTPVVNRTIEEAGIDAFVSIEDYHGKELTRYVNAVTDEDVDNRIASDLEMFTVEMPADTAIDNGMVADIAYVGTVDGVAFDGGSSESYDLLIGSHTFVDDFEEQLLGYKKGDQVEVIVNFPDDYGADLGGKEAHFAVTINCVKESIDEPTDEWVAANTEYKTVAEYYEGVRSEIQDNYDYTAESKLRSEVWEQIMEKAVFYQYPQNLVDKYAEMVKEQIEYMASAYYNATLDTFMQENGITEDYFAETGKEYVQRELVASYIILKEGETLDTPKVEEKAMELLALNGFKTREEANQWGVSDSQIDYAALNNVAVELVIGTANVTDVPAEEQPDAAAEEAQPLEDDEDAEEAGLKGAYEEEESGEG